MAYIKGKSFTTEEKNDLIKKYQEEVDDFTFKSASKIIDLISGNGEIPVWESPVFNTFFMNPASGTHFNLENSLLLYLAKKEFGYKDSLFITAKQGFDNGLSMEKGTTGHYIIQRFGMKMFPLSEIDSSGKPIKDSNGKNILKRNADGEIQYFYKRCAKLVKIFNIEQFKGQIPEKWLKYTNREQQTLENQEHLNNIKSVVIKSLPLKLERHSLGSNYYQPFTDKITLSEEYMFKNTLSELSTLFHEWSHATGHKERLNRESLYRYSEDKSFRGYEELVANFSARRLCNYYQLNNNELSEQFENNHDSYDAGWAFSAAKKSPELIFKAAADADRAFNLVKKTIEPNLKNENSLKDFLSKKIESDDETNEVDKEEKNTISKEKTNKFKRGI